MGELLEQTQRRWRQGERGWDETRVCDSRRGDLFFSGNVGGHLTAEEEEEQETESVLGCVCLGVFT